MVALTIPGGAIAATEIFAASATIAATVRAVARAILVLSTAQFFSSRVVSLESG